MTFTRALQIRRLAADLPLEAIVLETDAPDISPPGFIRHATARQLPAIGAALAEMRGMAPEQVAEATWHDALNALPRLAACYRDPGTSAAARAHLIATPMPPPITRITEIPAIRAFQHRRHRLVVAGGALAVLQRRDFLGEPDRFRDGGAAIGMAGEDVRYAARITFGEVAQGAFRRSQSPACPLAPPYARATVHNSFWTTAGLKGASARLRAAARSFR